MTVFADPSSNLHPFKCDGPGRCVHCDRICVVASSGEGTNHYAHDPSVCELCDPGYDGQPNEYRGAV